MAKIIEYNPTVKQLNPNDRALQAWETAGRRVGPLYNQAAQDVRQAGAVRGEMEKAKIWPFDIYALENSNAPQIHNTTSTETRATKGSGNFVQGISLSTSRGDGTGLLVGNGTSQGADYTNAYANAGYDTTPESAANDWIAEHGEGSAGAVGMSRMARAAAAGHNTHKKSLNPRFVRGGTVDLDNGNYFGGGYDDLVDTESGNIIGVNAARGPVNPNSNLPVNWHDNPYYNGDTLVNGPNGGQYTPYQIDQMNNRNAIAEDRAQEHAANKAYTQAQRQQAVDNRYQAGIDKWNRQKAAEDKADWNYWNGKNGWNTRRDAWIDGKGGLNDQWQSEYDTDIQQRANQQIDQYNASGKGQEGFVRLKKNDPRVIDDMRSSPTYTGDAPRSVTGPPAPAQEPGGVLNYLKNTFGSMFGSTLEDDNTEGEEDY